MSATTITEALEGGVHRVASSAVVILSQPLELIRIKNGVHEVTRELVTIATLAELVLGVVPPGDLVREDLVQIESAARQAIGKLSALRVRARERAIPMLRLVEDA